MAKELSILKKKIIFKKFKIRKLLDTSEFAWVYEGKDLIKNIPVAIKIEKQGNYNLLESEAYILMSVKGFGIPEIISFGKYGPFKILIEELLGKDIKIIWESGPIKKDPFGKNNTFIKDICLLAIQGIERLKYIHDKNVIHRDIKPKNFLIGIKNPNNIYLIDFGFAKKYRSSRTGKHIKFSKINYLYGSLNYASLNTIKGYESSRRDDLESLGYMLICLAKGGWTPWKIYENLKNKDDLIKNIIKMKLQITEEILCKGLPNEFIHYMKYVKKLDFEQEPDYQYLIGLFTSILSKNELKKNLTFFWIKQKTQIKRKQIIENRENKKSTSITKPKYINNSRINSHKRLYRKIKESLNKYQGEKNNINIYYNESKTKTLNSEKSNQRFNINVNNLSIKSLGNNIYNNNHNPNRTPDLNNPKKNRVINNLFQAFNIMDKKDNEKLLFQNHILDKKKKNSIKLINSTINNNKTISLYNNKYYIIKNSSLKTTPNNSRLNAKINEKRFHIYKSINNLNLKRNIVYIPKFKKSLKLVNIDNV